MLARFDADVIEEAPDLVLWQVGSNSVLRDHPTPAALIREGIEILKANGADVIIVDPQFAPKILAKPDAEHGRRHHGDRARRGGRPVPSLRRDALLARGRAACRSSSSSRRTACT